MELNLMKTLENGEAALRLRLGDDGRLRLQRGTEAEVAVNVRRLFPWSEPLSWLSLRDEEGKEVALIESVDLLPPDSCRELKRALQEASFVFVIEKIIDVEEEFELRRWRVSSQQGERVFQTRMNAWPRELSDGCFLIQDVANDLYLIPEIASLDAASQKRLWAFMDDDD